MRCPFCNADKESLKVIDSRTCDGGRSIRRRRQCLKCKKRFTTYERIEENARLTVVKRDSRRVPWDRGKILSGLERACFKTKVPESEIHRITDEVEEEIFRTFDREVPTGLIGQLVTDKLRRVDQVAYVRFASVYRKFSTLEELVEEARAVLDAKRFEDPSQGRLFLEAQQQLQQEQRRGGNGIAAEADKTGKAEAPKRPRRAHRNATLNAADVQSSSTDH